MPGLEAGEQHRATDVFDDQVHTAPLGDFADFSRPVRVVGINRELRAELSRQRTFRFGGPGADDASAELPGDLNCRRADAARAADDQHPIALANLCAVGEHVHRCAAGQRERGCCVELHTRRQPYKCAVRYDNLFRKTAISDDAQQLAAETERLIVAPAKFTFAAKEIRWHSHLVAAFPFLDIAANRPGPRLHRQACGAVEPESAAPGWFKPKIETIGTVTLD